MYEYDFKGKVALVTGAGSKQSMGRAIAMDLARLGADVVVSDKYMIPPTVREANKDWGGLAEIVKDIEKLGSKALAVECELGEPSACEAMTEKTVKTFGRLDFFVNSAGYRGPSGLLFEDMDLEVWKSVLDANLNGAFYLSKYAVKAMKKDDPKGKKIVFIASQAGVEGVPGMGAYSVAKHGVLGFMKSLARELAPIGINVNAISPLTVETNFRDKQAALEAEKKGMSLDEMIKADNISRGTNSNNLNVPLGRNGTVEDVTALVAFLLSPGSDYLTAQNIMLNGGNLSL
ncbi:MAG: SDR family oxidoreductase [Oscillospiraceae bacterium]|nr:SDR family oxidoreductase [Oscillospiraceae bacterium]